MPIVPTWGLNANACPAVQAPSAVLDWTAGTPVPVVGTAFANGPAPSLAASLNSLLVMVNALGRYGAHGGYAVASGLTIAEGTGLQAVVALGSAVSDGPQPKPASTTVSLTDAAENYLWLLRSLSVSNVVGSLTPPAATAVYLGRVTCAAGAPTAIDYSGRLECAGLLWRRTAGAGAPNDTPPAGLRFFAQTVGGIYVWTGSAYVQLG